MKQELKDLMFIYCTIILTGWLLSTMASLNKETKRLNAELFEAKTIAVELYNSREVYIDMLNSMNTYATELEQELVQYKYLEKFKKDLDRSPSK